MKPASGTDNDYVEDKVDVSFKRGYVAVLDALGAQYFTDKQATRFLGVRNRSIAVANEYFRSFAKPMADAGLAQYFAAPETITFGDTIVAHSSFDSDDHSHDSMSLIGIGRWLSALTAYSSFQGIWLRGAVSYGDYYVDRNTILGPALADAAQWHQQADWYGVLATPLLSFELHAMPERSKSDSWHWKSRWIEYAVPVKDDKRRLLQVVDWPMEYLNSAEAMRDGFFTAMSKTLCGHLPHIPPEAAAKHENVLAFVQERRRVFNEIGAAAMIELTGPTVFETATEIFGKKNRA